jgi:hypothetical protein
MHRVGIEPTTKSHDDVFFMQLLVGAAQTLRVFTHHILCVFVIPKSKKDRLTEPAIASPFREFDLADHYRRHPMATFHFGGG